MQQQGRLGGNPKNKCGDSYLGMEEKKDRQTRTVVQGREAK